MKSKQVIVIRKDLNMRKGKMISQGAHASLKAILDLFSFTPKFDNTITINALLETQDAAIIDWLTNKFTKITVYVNSEEELLEIFKKAEDANIKCRSIITDAGLTEFNGVPTLTACAIGPDWDYVIDPITERLSLL